RAVIKAHEGFAIAGRTSDVRIDHCQAKGIDEIVVISKIGWPELTIESAVDIDDHRPLTRERGGRSIKEAGNHPTVKAFPFDQLRLSKSVGLDSIEGNCPSFQPTGGDIY